MAARWEETLDHQLDLLKSLHTQPGRAYVEGWAQSVMGEAEDGKATGWVDAAGLPAPAIHPGEKAFTKSLLGDLPDRLASMVFNADPVYVDPDVMSIIEAATESFEPEPLQATDLITEAGFMWFPRPWSTVDIHGKQMSYRAVLWHPMRMLDPQTGRSGGEGVYLSLFHSIDDPDDYAEWDHMARAGGTGRLLLAHVAPWRFGEHYNRTNPNPAAGMWSTAKIVQCAWRLMLQTLSVRTSERASGPFRKRWVRADLPEKRVTVVRLRRPAQEYDPNREPGTVNWTHRWLVGGHWRWQWYAHAAAACGHCGKLDGVHRQIWISPFVKGPPELALEVRKARVFEFVQ